MSQAAEPQPRSHRSDHSRSVRRGRSRRRPIGFRVTDRDLELLGFVAAHRFALACHVQALLGADRAVTYRRLSGLTRAGLLSYQRIFHAQPGVFQVTNGGLALIDSPLLRSSVDLRTYVHDVGSAWLWIAARHGRFGYAGEVWSEREMRSDDQREPAGVDREPFGVQVDGYDRSGRRRVHHPDVLVFDQSSGATAFELELSMKSRRRLELILLGYSASTVIDRAVYLTDAPHVARGVRQAVDGLGLDGLVKLHYLSGGSRDRQWWMWRSITSLQGGQG